MTEQVFEFVSDWQGCKPGAVVCLAREAFVTKLIPFSEFDPSFGGYIAAEDSNETRYLGVWGRRVCRRFRETLRDRGATFDLLHEKPSLRVRHWGYHRHRDAKPSA